MGALRTGQEHFVQNKMVSYATNCFFFILNQICTFVATWVGPSEGRFRFQVQVWIPTNKHKLRKYFFLKNVQAEYDGVGASSSWVSVGFSKTALMPRSSAVLSSPDVSPVSRLYWNPADYGRPQEVKEFVGLNGGIQTDVLIRDEEYLYAQ